MGAIVKISIILITAITLSACAQRQAAQYAGEFKSEAPEMISTEFRVSQRDRITCEGRISSYAKNDRDGDGIPCEAQGGRRPGIGLFILRALRDGLSSGPIHVRGYRRRDGTYVRSHTRRR